MDGMHQVNIIIHVTCGSLALLVGLLLIIQPKGTKKHKKQGMVFVGLLSVVVLTGLIGVFIFKRNLFLLVITALSGYLCFSGYRTIKFKSNAPRLLDMVIAILTVCTLFYFLYFLKSEGFFWAPVVIYSTLGALGLVILYDFLRYLIPTCYYQRKQLWMDEHIYKMVSAFSALLAAFAGTVLDAYQPYSQVLPSLFGISLIIFFIIRHQRSRMRKPEKANQPSG